MRMLAALLLLALPLLPAQAGDPDKAEPPKKPAAKKQLDELVEDLLDELKTADPATQAKVAEELRRVLAGAPDVSALGVKIATPSLKLVLAGQGGETMTGSWTTDDGQNGTYTLKSLKDGIYELSATLEDKPIQDKGTLSDLRRKYPFLKEFMFLRPPFALELDGDLDVFTFAADPRLVGIRTRPPSEALRHHLELVAGSGLVIDTVLPGSHAEKLGLRRFDILLRIDGEVVEDRAQIKRLLEKGVTLEYIRRAKKKRLVTPATEEPADEKPADEK